jgi:nucleotide-binding universal stress UspA family protein
VCERLRPLNAACESVVVEGLPIPAIREAMRETESQLLILGAKGHSLLERLSLGSVSYHFAIGEAVNLLILRAPE